MRNCGIAKPDYETFRESVLYLAGEKLREPMVDVLAQRLAGNVLRLRHHIPVKPWTSQKHPEWVPVQAIAVQRVPDDRQGVSARLTLKILAGTPCPAVVRVKWSLKRCRVIAREIGFRQYGVRKDDPPPFPYTVPEELTSMRWEMLVDPDQSDPDPFLTEIRYKPALQTWNKAQLKRRMRIGFDCMAGHPLSFPCSQCVIGYLTCPAGTHRNNWRIRSCPECDEPEAFWDMDLCKSSCIRCYIRDLYRRR